MPFPASRPVPPRAVCPCKVALGCLSTLSGVRTATIRIRVEQDTFQSRGVILTSSRCPSSAGAISPNKITELRPVSSSSMRRWHGSSGPTVPNGDPLSDRIVIGAGMGPVFVEPPRQVIGVVGDTRDGGLNQDPGPTMYIPVTQMADKVTELNSRIAPLWWIVRTRMEPHTVTAAVTNAIREATGGLPVAHIRSMDEIVVLTTSRERFNMLLLTVFGTSALLMAAIGIYGLMA